MFSYGALKPGELLRVWMQFEVDPTSIGKRSYGIELDDEARSLARIDRTLRVLPLVVIGDLVQQGVTQSDYSLTGATTVLVTMAVLVVATAWLSFRFARLRPVLEGEQTLLIADGELLMRNLRRERMTVDEVCAEARQQSIGSLEDIRFAVLETNGKISFITGSS